MMTTETLEKMTVGYVVHGLNNSKAIALKKEYFSINYRSGRVHNGLVLNPFVLVSGRIPCISSENLRSETI